MGWDRVRFIYQSSIHDLQATSAVSGYDPNSLKDMLESDCWKATSQNTQIISFDAGTGGLVSADYLAFGGGNLKRAGATVTFQAAAWPFKSDWTEVTCGGNKAIGTAAAVVNSEIYVFGGKLNAGTPYDEMWKYNPATQVWSLCALATSDGGGRAYHTMCAMGKDLYIYGGFDASSTALNDCWKFDTTNNTFTQVASGIRARQKHGAAVSSGNMFVFGGINAQGSLMQDNCRYDPASNAWTEVRCHTVRRCSASMAAVGQYIYVAGGVTPFVVGGLTHNRFDTVNNSWAVVASGPTVYPAYRHRAVEVNSEIFCFGGYSTGKKMVRYSPSSNSWNFVADAPIGRYDHSLVNIGSVIYAFGGIATDTNSESNTIFSTTGMRVSSGTDEITTVLSGFSPEGDDLTLVYFPSMSKRNFQFVINGASMPPVLSFLNWGNYTEIGHLSVEADPYEQEHKANVNISEEGYLQGIWDYYTERQLRMSFDSLSNSEYTAVSNWWNNNGLKNFILQWEPSSHASEHWIVHADKKITQPFKTGGSYQDVKFSLRGRKIETAVTGGIMRPTFGTILHDVLIADTRSEGIYHPHKVDFYIPYGTITRSAICLHGGGGSKEALMLQLYLSKSRSNIGLEDVLWDVLDYWNCIVIVPQGQACTGLVNSFNPSGVTTISSSYPQGVAAWDNYQMYSQADDVQFLKDLSMHVTSNYGSGIGKNLCGHSQGGMMVSRMWYEAGSWFQHFCSMGAGPPKHFIDTTHVWSTGSPLKPFIQIIGQHDDVLNVENGPLGDGNHFYDDYWQQGSSTVSTADVYVPLQYMGAWKHLQEQVDAFTTVYSYAATTIQVADAVVTAVLSGYTKEWTYSNNKAKVILATEGDHRPYFYMQLTQQRVFSKWMYFIYNS